MIHKEADIIGRNRYKLVRILGDGTYGLVWLAHDKNLDTSVAVKTLHPQMGMVADLQKEAKTQASLSHPNIARIQDVDFDDRFIAMEYVDGLSLEEKLRDHAEKGTWIHQAEAKQILMQCLQALMYAHEKQVVHGDIKPGNIMIESNGTVKITDFGVAKIHSEEETHGYGARGVRRLGSVTYIAPEVLKGDPRTFSSDIFSLGILAYLLFTGCHPFYNVHPSGLFGVRDNLLSDEEAKNPREINEELPENYADVIMKLICKDCENRYSSIKQAYEDFAGIALSCPICEHRNTVDAKYCNQCGNSLIAIREGQYKDKSPDELARIAFELNGLGEHEEAITFSDAALEKDSACAQAHFTKGFALSSMRRYEEALESFDEALSATTGLTPDDLRNKADICTKMGFCYERRFDYSKSLELLLKAREFDPSYDRVGELLERGVKRGYWTEEDISR